MGVAAILWVLVCFIDTGYGNTLWFNPIPFLLGSVFPDTDIKSSSIGKFVPLWIFFKHRGFTHSLPAMILFSGAVALHNVEWAFAFGGGYLLHLLMDSSTPMGIKWLTGHKRKRT